MNQVFSQPDHVRSRLGTEFGRALGPLVDQIPGAIAAVLSDEEGDAIDFAHHPGQIDEIDVQLLGAQIGHAVLRLQVTSRRHRLGSPAVLVDARQGRFVAAAVAETYILALMLSHRANVGRALEAFDTVRAHIEDLLVG